MGRKTKRRRLVRSKITKGSTKSLIQKRRKNKSKSKKSSKRVKRKTKS